MSILQRVRADLVGAGGPASGVGQAGEGLVRLDRNENPFDLLGGSVPDINRFPPARPRDLYAALAANYSVGENQLLITRGGVEGIDWLMRVFCQPGLDEVLLVSPTRRAYHTCAWRNGALVKEHSTRVQSEFQPRVPALLAALSGTTKMILMGSPNDPTGQVVPLETVDKITHSARDRCLVVVDESFLEFSDTPSAVALLSEHDNLVVVRSMSYTWALAGARCGVLLGNPDVIACLEKFARSGGLATPVINIVLEALAEKDLAARLAVLEVEKNWLVRQLEGLAVVDRCFPSAANFLLLRLHDFEAVRAAIGEAGVAVLDVSDQPGLERCLRVSVGLRHDHDVLLAALRSVAAT